VLIDEWRLAAKEHERCSINRYERAIEISERLVLNREAAAWARQLLRALVGADSKHLEAIKAVIDAASPDGRDREKAVQDPSREVDQLLDDTKELGRDSRPTKQGRKELAARTR
jgi:hypothetical protein